MKIHVNLALPRSYATEDIEHEGTLLDPYSWSDVKKHLIKAASDGFDDGSSLDANRSLDSDGFAVEFLCFGDGNIISEADKIDISSIRFNKPSHIVKFAPLDFWSYGLPVIRSSSTLTGSLISISASANLVFDFSGFIIDTAHSAQYNLIHIQNAKNATVRFHNNVVLSRSAGVTLTKFTNLEYSKVAIGTNTIQINSPSTVHHNLFDFAGTHLDTNVLHVANYVARHQSTANTITVLRGVSGVKLRTSGNRYSYTASFNDYSGSSMNRTTLDSDLTCDYATQGVFNDALFDGSTSYSTASVDCFFPVHAGLLLGVCDKPSDTYGILNSDPTGRLIGTQVDAGVFQKSHIAPVVTDIHVDLAVASHSTTATGSELNPLPLPDFLRYYARIAPVGKDYVFHLRNYNATQVPVLDLGPLAPDTVASDRRFSGSGTITVTSYKKYSLKQATFGVDSIKLNANLNVVFDDVRLFWNAGQDFAKSGEVSNPNKLVDFSRCVIRSTANCTASLLDQANSTCDVRFLGSTIHLLHTQGNLDASGVFVNADGSKLDVVLCTIVTPSQQMGVANGTTRFVGNYVNGVVSFLFPGAVLESNRVNNANLDEVFVDHDNALYRNADYRLAKIFEGNAKGVVQTPTVIAPWYDLVKVDARGLVRDATASGGSPSYDAGAYEFDYLVPVKEKFYVDISNRGQSSELHSGTQRDRLTVANVIDKFESLKNSNNALDHGLEFVFSGKGKCGFVVEDVEFSDSGFISFLNESVGSVAVLEGSSPVLGFDNLLNATIYIDGVILKNETVDPNLKFASSTLTLDSKVFLNRTIVWKKQRAYFELPSSNTFDNASTLLCGTYEVTRGVDWAVGATTVDTAANIVAAFKAKVGFSTDYNCYQDSGTRIVLQAVTTASCDLDTDDSNISVFDANAESVGVSVAAGWEVFGFGSSICEVFDTGVVRTTHGVKHLAGSKGSYLGMALQGEVGKSGVSISGDSNVSVDGSKYHGFSAPTCTSTATLAAPSVYTDSYSNDIVAPGNFVLEDGFDVMLYPDILDPTKFKSDIFVDITGAYRSEKFIGGDDAFDIGAVEFNKLSTNLSFPNVSDRALAVITPVGMSMNIRHDIDGVGFRVIGYTLNNAGYLYWQPSRISTALPSGEAAVATVTLNTNVFTAGSSIQVTFGSAGSASATYNISGGFLPGATIEETARNILQSLNNSAVFRKYAYGIVNESGLKVVAKRFGLIGNSYTTSKVGSNIVVSGFTGGVEANFQNKVWPVSSEYATFDRIETLDAQSFAYVVRLSEAQANSPIGELAIIGEVTQSPILEEIGTKFVYAVSRFGLHSKHDREIMVKRFIFQF